MKSVDLLGIKVSFFAAKDLSVECEITFSDGRARRFHKTVKPTDAKVLTKDIIAEIKNVVRRVEFDGVSLSEKEGSVILRNEPTVKKKLFKFFTSLVINVKRVADFKQAEGYIDAVNRVRFMKLKF